MAGRSPGDSVGSPEPEGAVPYRHRAGAARHRAGRTASGSPGKHRTSRSALATAGARRFLRPCGRPSALDAVPAGLRGGGGRGARRPGSGRSFRPRPPRRGRPGVGGHCVVAGEHSVVPPGPGEATPVWSAGCPGDRRPAVRLSRRWRAARPWYGTRARPPGM